MPESPSPAVPRLVFVYGTLRRGESNDITRLAPAPCGFDALPNVSLLPHLGAFTHEAQERVIDAVCRDVKLVLAGQPAVEYVNFPESRR